VKKGGRERGRERAKEISPKVGHMPELAISSRADRWHTDPGHISESQFRDFPRWLTMNGPRSILRMPPSKCFLSPFSYRLSYIVMGPTWNPIYHFPYQSTRH